MSHQVDFQPIGRRGPCAEDESLLQAARRLGIELTSDCGGQGICGQCVVRVLEGRASQATWAEQDQLGEADLAAGYRLACMAYPLSNLKAGVPATSLSVPLRVQVSGYESTIALAPAVRAYLIQVPRPSLEEPHADADSLLAQLRTIFDVDVRRCALPVLQELSPNLRAWNWRCQAVVRGDEVIAVLPLAETEDAGPAAGQEKEPLPPVAHRLAAAAPLGLAFDLGSTSIAGYLVDLDSGATLAARGAMNPQITYGEDIISRMVHAHKSPDGAANLRQAAREGLNHVATALCQETGVDPARALDAVVVGNTAMHHLLLGLPTRQLTSAPFVPAIAASLDLLAGEVGLAMAPTGYVHILPNIAGFVGADHVAMLLATEAEWQGRTAIALDVGTNTEISLTLPDGRISSVSCASGPAFEGYHIKDGTRAGPGAVERVRVRPADGAVEVRTIDNLPAAGICGSGILDAVAQLQLAGVLAESGRLQPDTHPALRETNGQREFVLVPPDPTEDRRGVTITQHDVREIQLAKASIQTGVELLLAQHEVPLDRVERFIIAGAFGSYIDIPNAIAIGMFPALPLERFHQVGNAAGTGARLALLSTALRDQARALHGRITYLELATHPRFARAFAHNCRLRPYDAWQAKPRKPG